MRAPNDVGPMMSLRELSAVARKSMAAQKLAHEAMKSMQSELKILKAHVATLDARTGHPTLDPVLFKCHACGWLVEGESVAECMTCNDGRMVEVGARAMRSIKSN